MIDPKIDIEIQKWNSIGLNIYLAIPLSDLSDEIRNYFVVNQIDLTSYQSLVLIGNGGKRFGQNFEYPLDENKNPIDNFTLMQLSNLNSPLVLYPSEKYIPPLQKISRFFEFSHQSPLGLDISKEFGLWFAFRALFLTKEKMPKSMGEAHLRACETCSTKECLQACPAEATALKSFNLKNCATYRLAEKSTCHDRCHARLACPYQSVHQYELTQIQYHMTRERHLIKLSDFK